MNSVIAELELAISEMVPTASEVIDACRRNCDGIADEETDNLSDNEIAHALLLNRELLAACVEWARR